MDVRVKISLVDDEGRPFMGPGMRRLLEHIEDHRSIAGAAREMGLSYVKALRMLVRLEQGAGRPLVERFRGGAARGGARLTPDARDFLVEYARLENRIRAQARRELESVRSPDGRSLFDPPGAAQES